MVGNRVTPNILMLVLLVGGLAFATQVRQEVFPEFEIDVVTVQVVYPGASPEEVERGIVLVVEEATRGVDGVDQVTSTASEGVGTVMVEVLSGADPQQVFDDVRQAVDRVSTLPEQAERPSISLLTHKREVLALQIFGDASEPVLRELAERARDQLLQQPEITQVELEGARNYEIHAEIPRENLRAYNLTLNDIAGRIAQSAVEVPAGRVETRSGEILLRTNDRRDWAAEFLDIPVVTTAQGGVVRLGSLGTVAEDFEEVDRSAMYDQHPSVGLSVFRVGDQTPTGVADAVRRTMAEIATGFPDGIDYAINRDRSEIYKQRLTLLIRNASIGLVLVLGMLSLFLELRLAAWVTIGIPTSFLGALLFLPALDVSINMVSMFAFIIALGIVVDDAIIAGENIYEHRQRGGDYADAAITGAREVAVPISFSILTNIVAFLPMMFVPGVMGKIWGVIPAVVTTVFILSWIEALFILPSHLAHSRRSNRTGWQAALHTRQQAFSAAFSRFVERRYGGFIDRALQNRYLAVAVALAVLIVVLAYAGSGRLGFTLMPKTESDRAVVNAVLPLGSPEHAVADVRDHLVEAARMLMDENGGDTLVEGLYAVLDRNTIEVTAYLTDPTIRPLTTGEFADRWREQVGPLAGVESLRFESDRGGPGRGPALTIELSHTDITILEHAAAALAEAVAEFDSAKDIDDGQAAGKRQIEFRLRDAGHSLGLTTAELGRQVRNAFYGAEALRQQRARSEVKVLVHLPRTQRAGEDDVERLMIRTPSGREVPLTEVAEVHRGRAYTDIQRRDGRRVAAVTADVVPAADSTRILETIEAEVLPDLLERFPGLEREYEGRQAVMRDSVQSLLFGLGTALVLIYVLLAIPFRSYSQPTIVMVAIPFGIVGAIIGHQIMGYQLSVVSLMGIVALSGVVVNDSLVLIDYANRRRAEGLSPFDAIHSAGIRRFRPILLTTITTFGGLAPMIFETSRQARFMIPMAISLGYGILFATAISLVLVPCLYLILEDLKTSAKLQVQSAKTGAHPGEVQS